MQCTIGTTRSRVGRAPRVLHQRQRQRPPCAWYNTAYPCTHAVAGVRSFYTRPLLLVPFIVYMIYCCPSSLTKNTTAVPPLGNNCSQAGRILHRWRVLGKMHLYLSTHTSMYLYLDPNEQAHAVRIAVTYRNAGRHVLPSPRARQHLRPEAGQLLHDGLADALSTR